MDPITLALFFAGLASMVRLIVVVIISYFVAGFHDTTLFSQELECRDVGIWKSELLQAPLDIVKSEITVLNAKDVVLSKRIQWFYKDGYVEETTAAESEGVYLANEKYSARLKKADTGYSIKSLHQINQAGKRFRSHLFATSTTASQDGSVLFFPDLLASGELVVTESETENGVQTIHLAPTEHLSVGQLKSVVLRFDTLSRPLPFSCIVENVDGSRARNEFSNFIDVAGYSVPLEGKSFVWNAQCEKWVEADYSAKYGYMQGEVSETDVSRLYLPYYGIAEPADPVLATSDFGRGSSIPIVVALSIIAGLVAAVFFWLK